MIHRTADAALVNELAAAQGQPGDFTELLAEPLHVCLLDGESGALFAWRGPGIYEVHVFFAVRGRGAIDLLGAMQAHMRERFGASLFWALIPIESRRVIMFVRLSGWKSHGPLESRLGWHELFSKG